LSEAHADGAPARSESSDDRAVASPPGSDTLARIVFAVLVVACFAAFLITQRLKHTPTAVQNFKLTTAFSPHPGARTRQEGISFKLAAADAVTVQIVDERGDVVATLVHERPVPRYKQFSLRWNGRRGFARGLHTMVTPAGHAIVVPENRGALAPPGEYRVRVTLHKRAEPVYSPRDFQLLGDR
jgi:hypothetical protein